MILLFLVKLYIISFSIKNIKSTKISFKNISIPKLAFIPFKTFYPPINNNITELSPKEYFEHIHLSNIYLEIEVAKNIKYRKLTKEEQLMIRNNKQFISFFITLNDFISEINDTYFLKNIKTN